MRNRNGLVKILEKEEFAIYEGQCGLILCNDSVDGFAHTHIDRFVTAQWLIDLSLHKRIPKNIKDYLLISLIRINTDEVYCRKLTELLQNRKRKERYYNSKMRRCG